MRKFITGQSLDPVEGDVYLVLEDTGAPDHVILFKEQVTEETAGTHPTDAASKVEFVNKVLSDKGLEALTDEEAEFLGAA
jgi:hypothetical protein